MERIFAIKEKLILRFSGFVLLFFFLSAPAAAATQSPPFIELNRGWQYRLGGTPYQEQNIFSGRKSGQWHDIHHVAKPERIPDEITSVWYRIKLPKDSWPNPCIYFEKIDAQSFMIYLNNVKVYEKIRERTRYDNKVMIPLGRGYRGTTLMLQVVSKNIRKNLFSPIRSIFLGNYNDLIIKYFQNGFVNLIFGFSLALSAIIMVFCSFFLKKNLKKSWISLCAVTFISGIGVAIYPNNLSPFSPFFDKYSTIIVDVATFILLPMLTYFFKQLLIYGSTGSGRSNLFSYLSPWCYCSAILAPACNPNKSILFMRMKSPVSFMSFNSSP